MRYQEAIGVTNEFAVARPWFCEPPLGALDRLARRRQSHPFVIHKERRFDLTIRFLSGIELIVHRRTAVKRTRMVREASPLTRTRTLDRSHQKRRTGKRGRYR